MLDQKRVQYGVIELDTVADGKYIAQELANKVGNTSVPQIFINGDHISGFGKLRAANSDGSLDQKLAQDLLAVSTPNANRPAAN